MKKYLLLAFIIIILTPAYSQHAPGYVDSTIESQSWDGTNWVPGTNTFFYYHASDTLYYNSITKAWDTATLAYDINQSQQLVTYTGSHKIQQNQQQSWVTSQAAWRNTSQLLYTYDVKNNLTNYTTQVWDTTLSVWVNSSQALSTYDNNNNNTQYLLQYWNTGTGTWRNYSLQAGTFDGGNRLVQSIRQSWDTVANVWVNAQKDTLEYKSADTTYGVSQAWDIAGNTWVNSQEAINAFDASGNNTWTFTLGWNNTTKTYDSTDVQQFTYNTNNELVSERSREFSADVGSHYNVTYDSLGNIETLILVIDELVRQHSWDIFFSINSAKLIYTWKPAATTLPITLLNFSGNPIGNTMQLQWSTATEINSGYFEVQRSADGNNFEPIGKVAAAGNADLTQTYSFTDNAPKINAINFYRLKEVDRDGHFVYSKIIAGSFNEKVLVKIYPNPATDNVLIDVNGVPTGNYHINLTDVSGKVVLSKDCYITAGRQPISLSLSSYATGLYFFEMRDILNHVITNQKIVKQ